MRALDVVFAFPVFLLAIAVVAALGPTVPNLILTIAIVYTPTMARVVRGPVLSVKRWDHVEAARSVGVGEFADRDHATCCRWWSRRSWCRSA
jgi:peptide/nickel transport system permease protein